MSSGPTNHVRKSDQSRLRLKPARPVAVNGGIVDGAWWPRSRDLAAELPALFDALAVRLGGVEQMAYNLTEWEAVSRRATDQNVRLVGFRDQAANTVGLTGPAGNRLVLLVIPPETSSVDARDVSMAAAGPENADSVNALLARRGTRRFPHQRSDTDGEHS